MTLYHIAKKSGNKKTGPIPVTTTDRKSCPTGCVHYRTTCYAEDDRWGNWRLVGHPKGTAVEGTSKLGRGLTLPEFLADLESLPLGTGKIRHNQAGDLPHLQGHILGADVRKISSTMSRFPDAWTYTHHNPEIGANLSIIQDATWLGLTVNMSADTLMEADRYRELNLPTTLVVPEHHPRVSSTPAGHKIVVCPEQTKHVPNCKACPSNRWCASSDRKFIIGFRAHGKKKEAINERGI